MFTRRDGQAGRGRRSHAGLAQPPPGRRNHRASRQRAGLASRAGGGRGWSGGPDATADPEPECQARGGEGQDAKGFGIDLVGQERIEQILSWHQIATEEEFGEALHFAATLIPVERVRVALLGDGAPWLWAQREAAFPTGKEILDYDPCSERVHHGAHLQDPEQHQQAFWIAATRARLNFGAVASVIWGLQRRSPASMEAEEEIRKLIGYLHPNSPRLNYRAFKRGQSPRGSGGLESANTCICHVRMKRSGAWW